jgi:hypothetical protein
MGDRVRPEEMRRMCWDTLGGVGTQEEVVQEKLGLTP